MQINHTDAKMEAGGITRTFYVIDAIKDDEERFNWDTWRMEFVESKTSQKYFVENLKGLTEADRVELYINSMGGSVKEALGIYNELRRCPAAVTAHIDGFAASAASIIAMAADKIIMPHNTCMMIHNASWMTYGNPSQLRKSADDLEVINMAAIQSYMVHAGDRLPADQLRRMLDAETWLTAEDCMAYGLADEFGEEDVDISKAVAQYKAAKQMAEGSPAACLFRNAPAAIAKALAEAPEEKPQEPPKETPKEEPAEDPEDRAQKSEPEDKKSGIYMLLKTMTNN